MLQHRLTTTGRGPRGALLGRSLAPLDAREGGAPFIMRPYLSSDAKQDALEAAKVAAKDRAKVDALAELNRRKQAKIEANAQKAVEADPIGNIAQLPKAFPKVMTIAGLIALGLVVYIGVRIAKG